LYKIIGSHYGIPYWKFLSPKLKKLVTVEDKRVTFRKALETKGFIESKIKKYGYKMNGREILLSKVYGLEKFICPDGKIDEYEQKIIDVIIYGIYKGNYFDLEYLDPIKKREINDATKDYLRLLIAYNPNLDYIDLLRKEIHDISILMGSPSKCSIK
jgi:hypothetical protein